MARFDPMRLLTLSMKSTIQPPMPQQEELLARIKKQDELILNVEKEIYENVSQVLCLARIKLINLDLNDKDNCAKSLEQSGNLIGKAISDLRNLAKQVHEL